MTDSVETRRLPRLPPRHANAHKGDFGRVLIVAGSLTMPGAAILAARAALRAGAGLVTIASDGRHQAALAAGCPEATQIQLPAYEVSGGDQRDGILERLSPEELLRFDALVVGPGLGTSDGAREIVRLTLGAPRPQVVDADALNIVADGLPVEPRADRVWTPHPGELARLTGAHPESHVERVLAASQLVETLGGVAVLKGRRSVVARRGAHFVNPTGNPGMATGGSGDVLSGLIAALLAQGLNAFDSASLGVYLHGLAGDLAARDVGETSLIASDLIDAFGEAFRARHQARSS